MKKLVYLLMSLSVVAFASCSDKEKTFPVSKSGTQDGHDYVYLGLPSGTKWATCNVGATKPEDYGNSYAWGETTTKETYDWSNYKYGSFDYDDYNYYVTKYCNNRYAGKDGFTDSKTTLDLSDDAAYVNWGGKWRMPTKEQQDELRNQCYWIWTNSYNNSGVEGYIVYKAKNSDDKGRHTGSGCIPSSSSSYSLSDAHIFLPAAGENGHRGAGYAGYYWSSSLSTGIYAFGFISTQTGHVGSYDGSGIGYERYHGQSVRAVIPGY